MGFPGSILLTQGDQYVQTAAKRHPLGTRGYTRDGRSFRYAKAGGTALAIAKLMQAEAPDTDVAPDINPATSTAPSVASRTITLELATGSTIAANDYADGYLYINDGTGEGQMVQISGNSAITTATGNIDFYLRDEGAFTVAPTTACEMSVIKNKYDDIIVRGASGVVRTSIPLGVTPRAVTANNYFWLQTWGPCPVVTGGTVIIGNPVGDSSCTLGECSATGGSVHSMDTSTTALTTTPALSLGVGFSVGNVLRVGAATEYSLIDLKIEP